MSSLQILLVLFLAAAVIIAGYFTGVAAKNGQCEDCPACTCPECAQCDSCEGGCKCPDKECPSCDCLTGCPVCEDCTCPDGQCEKGHEKPYNFMKGTKNPTINGEEYTYNPNSAINDIGDKLYSYPNTFSPGMAGKPGIDSTPDYPARNDQQLSHQENFSANRDAGEGYATL